MLKIMIQANSPDSTKSGYGIACYFLVQILQKLGHEVSVFAYYGQEGSIRKWNGITLYPRGHNPYGNDIVEAHMVRFGGDLLITMIDVHVLERYGRRPFHWLPIVPVDGDPLTDGIKHALPGALGIVSMSKYGEQVLKEEGLLSTMIYLPVDTSTYTPFDRRKAREIFHWPPDAYVFGNIGMNRGFRKGQDLLLQAFQIVVSEIPDARLYLGADIKQPDGLDLDRLIRNLGIANYVITPQRYDAFLGQTFTYMNGLYNTFDCYVSPSLNEGQCMPLWEALSCSLPIVATAATAQTEALEDADAIAVAPMNKVWLPSNCFGYEVSVEDLANAMINAYRKWGKQYVSLQNRQKAIENVSLNVVGMQWQDVLAKIEKRIRFTPTVRPWAQNPSVVQVSTNRPNCGIAIYTQALMASLGDATNQSLVDILSVQSADQIPDCDILHLHFENSIFPNEQLMREILHGVKQRGTKVVCTFHTIMPNIANALLQEKLLDMGIVHWPFPGMECDPRTIAVLGGMGIPVYRPPSVGDRGEMREKYGFPINAKIISTLGFAALGRGHFEVLEELAPFLISRKDIHLQIITAENAFNPLGYKIVVDEIRRIARDFNLAEQIHFIGQQITNLEVMNRLWMSDVGFLYLGLDVPSTSSAARQFVSARLPLVVTKSTHFGDLRFGVKRTDFPLMEFARALLTLVDDHDEKSRLRKEHERTYGDFMWPLFGEKHLSIYKTVLGG